jgi:beta-lactamase superfamily II metal-dependent hydrolase
MASNLTVNVRMYQVGELGDCFLLSFNEGNKVTDVLVDCGSFRNSGASKQRLQKIVTHINSSLNGKKLDVVIGTHQHNDHVSGFVHCEDLFKDNVEEVWLSWLDNPKDAFARRIKADQQNLMLQLKSIHTKLTALKGSNALGVVNDVLGFYGLDGDAPEIPAKGIEILKGIGSKAPRYLSPGQTFDLPGMPENTVKVYVLGPPRKQALLFDKDPTKDESFDPHLAMASNFAGKMLSAVNGQGTHDAREEQYFPFNYSYKKKAGDADKDILAIYNKQKDAWRKIDKDWLEQADRLALYLDSYTNNSSLVLAFELVESQKVLLFVGDAQTGNWNSWGKIKWEDVRSGFTTDTLLENTVVYKVGHHASHNATLVSAFNTMGHDEMIAMIPVDKNDPNITKLNGWKMPAKNLYKKLKEKTKFRVLRMDDGFAEGCDPVKNKDKSKWKELPFKPKIDKVNNFIEYKVQG